MKKLIVLCLIFVSIGFYQEKSLATNWVFHAALDGYQQIPHPSIMSTGLGALTGRYDDANNTLTFQMAFTGLLSPTVSSHFHAPAYYGDTALITLALTDFPTGVTVGNYNNFYLLTDSQEVQLLSGLWYIDICTIAYPDGELRGQMFQALTSINENNTVPIKYNLDQNYPNPFNPSTVINYQLPNDENVKVSIFDNAGKEVATLIDEFKPAGYYAINFDGSNLASGIYFYTLVSNNFTATKKMLLIK